LTLSLQATHPQCRKPPAPRTVHRCPRITDSDRQQAVTWSRTRAAMCRSLFGVAEEGCDYGRTLAK